VDLSSPNLFFDKLIIFSKNYLLIFCSIVKNNKKGAKMTDQLHKKFSSSQVKSLLESYIRKEIGLSYILSILGIGRSRFFKILKAYRQNPSAFSIEYARNKTNNKIASEVEDDILAELYIEKR
jgi:hypothetical protein